MPDWLMPILVGGVIMGLIGVIYKGVLTKHEHSELCLKNTKELMGEVKGLVTERMDDLKEFMLKDVKIAILEEMRNGRSEHR